MTGNATEDATSRSCFITGACVCQPGFVRDLEGACILWELCDLVEATTSMLEITTAADLFNATTEVPFFGTTDSVIETGTDVTAIDYTQEPFEPTGYTFGPTEDVTGFTEVTGPGVFTLPTFTTDAPVTDFTEEPFTEVTGFTEFTEFTTDMTTVTDDPVVETTAPRYKNIPRIENTYIKINNGYKNEITLVPPKRPLGT